MVNVSAEELARPDQADEARQSSPAAIATRVATVVAEPLERGFGMTLGNALRRVLLSSLQGAAIKTVQIDGVLHEFSSIPGVREDVTNIILNIKEIALRIHSDGVKRMVLKKEGAGPVTAGDIEASSDVEILNPDHVICHLDQGASIRMEFTADMGKGYVPAERNRPEDAPIGLIPVDSLYSPGQEGVLQGREHPRGPDPRLRQADHDGRDGRLGSRRGCRGARRPHPAGPARRVHQLRRAEEGRRRDARIPSWRSTRRCSRRSTNSSFRCARRTA